MITVSLKLNGKPVARAVRPFTTLLHFLREELNVKSVKYGCGEGACGACTVLVDGEPMLSCLLLAASVEGKEITTLEGLGTPSNLHPLQKAFMEHFATQCGYCTPGMILVAKALLDKVPTPTRDEIAEALSGNLCRCTGYIHILNAVELVAKGNGSRRS